MVPLCAGILHRTPAGWIAHRTGFGRPGRYGYRGCDGGSAVVSTAPAQSSIKVAGSAWTRAESTIVAAKECASSHSRSDYSRVTVLAGHTSFAAGADDRLWHEG